ncbi:MAG: TetR/AcrR family transcriptional regulator [Mariprofundaceae bacterium]
MGARERILQAAGRRFAEYGYHKTTMAEIAADCGMSVGNLYRHFRNKEAIAVESTRRVLEAKLAAGRQAAAREEDAFAALRAFLLARLETGHRHVAGTRHVFDMIRLINERHRDLLLDYEARVIAALAEILARGVESGRFAVANPAQTAYDIHQATIRYNNPVYLRNNPLDRLKTDLQRLVSLLDQGLAPRHHTTEEE